MKIALVADTYPPMNTSGAIQLRDLAESLAKSHEVTVFATIDAWTGDNSPVTINGVSVIRFRSLKKQNCSRLRRAIGELLTPYVVLLKSHEMLSRSDYDGVIAYSPSIFLGPIVRFLKKRNGCNCYLIIRDIFPKWALDLGLISKGPAYWFLSLVARRQYAMADVIGVQSPSNVAFIKSQCSTSTIEVLNNWNSRTKDEGCRINISQTHLKGRRICVYAGNMGIAQDIGLLLQVAKNMKENDLIGFLFVGRGSLVDQYKEYKSKYNLNNVLIESEIHSSEMHGLLKQCSIGLVSLNRAHKTHNIPGKFISYIQHEIPVIASVNPGNDLIQLVRESFVGYAESDGNIKTLERYINDICSYPDGSNVYKQRCAALYNKLYSSETASAQIVSCLQ